MGARPHQLCALSRAFLVWAALSLLWLDMLLPAVGPVGLGPMFLWGAEAHVSHLTSASTSRASTS